MSRVSSRCFQLILLACLALAGCHREVVAPGDPVAAVKGMAAAIRDNDLVRYSRLSVPPQLHRRMEARWSANLKAAPPPTEAQQRDYAKWMARLTADDAETRLYRSYDGKMKKIQAEISSQWPLMQATGGIFVNGLIQANDHLSSGEKDHAKAVGSALLDWLSPRLLSDRAKARQAIAILTSTARDLDLPTLQQSRQLEMIPALEKAGRILKAFKEIGRIYGLDADASLAGLQARVVAVDGDVATMEVSYPLLGKTVSFEMQLLRRDGRWYSADAVHDAEAELVRPLGSAGQPVRP
jgi:hypothetical protein